MWNSPGPSHSQEATSVPPYKSAFLSTTILTARFTYLKWQHRVALRTFRGEEFSECIGFVETQRRLERTCELWQPQRTADVRGVTRLDCQSTCGQSLQLGGFVRFDAAEEGADAGALDERRGGDELPGGRDVEVVGAFVDG